mmetsp:Transcript_16944/g.64228  ORF Transcript_16944/g.64228 Transcript_16944/m.64228 type:complete len:232 (-) Transcript_16944:525-1220(-)
MGGCWSPARRRRLSEAHSGGRARRRSRAGQQRVTGESTPPVCGPQLRPSLAVADPAISRSQRTCQHSHCRRNSEAAALPRWKGPPRGWCREPFGSCRLRWMTRLARPGWRRQIQCLRAAAAPRLVRGRGWCFGRSRRGLRRRHAKLCSRPTTSGHRLCLRRRRRAPPRCREICCNQPPLAVSLCIRLTSEPACQRRWPWRRPWLHGRALTAADRAAVATWVPAVLPAAVSL